MGSLLAKPLTWLVFGLSSKPTFLLAAGLTQALGMAAGIINAFGLVAVFGGLIGACISALSERHVGGVKTSRGRARLGNCPSDVCRGREYVNITPQAIN